MALLALSLSLTACGSASEASAVRTHSASATQTVSTTAGATRAATTSPASAPGTVLLTASGADAVCASRFGAEWHTLESGDGHLLPGGRVALLCGPPADGEEQLLVYDLLKGVVLWTMNIGGDASELDGLFGDLHFYTISSSTTPAQGLQPVSTTYTLSAIDWQTGSVDWTASMGTQDPTTATILSDGPSGVPGHPDDVVVTYEGGTSAYDASTGQQLWHTSKSYTTEASGYYTTGGIVEISGYQDNEYGQHFTGFDAATGRQLWDLRLPSDCATQDTYVLGDVEWGLGSSCLEEHNVLTGALVAERQFPPEWSEVTATPLGVAVWDGTDLKLFKPTDLTRPMWSVPAGQTRTVAISTGHMLVEAPSGPLVLNTANGSITAHVSGFDAEDVHPQASGGFVVDGLVEAIAADGETSVLELDPPTQ